MTSDSIKSPTEMPHCGKGEQQDSATFKMLHHKKEDENLWIASKLIWFDQPRPPDSSQTAPVKTGPSS
ncbi:hypothetical protein STEG23_023495 [Scotinomys teguina]